MYTRIIKGFYADSPCTRVAFWLLCKEKLPHRVQNISVCKDFIYIDLLTRLHCNENHIYVFLSWELRGHSPNFNIYVSVSDVCIPMIGPYISFSTIGRSIVGICKSLTDKRNVEIGNVAAHYLYGNICFEFSVLAPCSVSKKITVDRLGC